MNSVVPHGNYLGYDELDSFVCVCSSCVENSFSLKIVLVA